MPNPQPEGPADHSLSGLHPSTFSAWEAGIYVGFDCAVVDGSVTSDWFMIKSGVKQGCVTVGIPILTVLGLGHVVGNSRQKKRGKVECHNSPGGP